MLKSHWSNITANIHGSPLPYHSTADVPIHAILTTNNLIENPNLAGAESLLGHICRTVNMQKGGNIEEQHSLCMQF